MNKILTYLLLIAAIGFAIWWVLSQKPSHMVEDTRPEHKIEAIQLSQEFYNDESLANENYLNKFIAVEGEVLRVGNQNGKREVWLKGAQNGPALRCVLSKRLDQRTEFQNNEKLRLKCVCAGLTEQIELVQCEEF